MRRRLLAVGVVGALLVVGVGVALVAADGDDGPTIEVTDGEGPADHDYVIPRGTAERIAAGEEVAIVPQRLEAKVGETIRIRNDDDAGANVGIFYVGAGETVRMTFTSPGELKGTCDVHPSGEFTIAVSAA